MNEAALYFRKRILSYETTELPMPLNTEVIEAGQRNKTDELIESKYCTLV